MQVSDYKKQLKEFYLPSAKSPAILEIPSMPFAMIDGYGDPNTSPVFQDAVSALYAISYGIKMLPKKGITPAGYFPYTISALEGLWSMQEGIDYVNFNKEDFVWTLMIMQPSFVTQELFYEVLNVQKKKKGLEAMDKLRLSTLEEGLCCQIMHLGPFDDEPATFARMQQYTEAQGYRRTEKDHHEIYLNDFRKTAPEKLKTVLRFKVEKI